MKAKRSREIAAEFVSDAVDVLKAVMLDKKAPPQARVAAADKILDRAEGKAEQNVNVSNLDGISDEQLASAIAALASAVAEEDAGRAGEASGAEQAGELPAVR